MINANEMMKVFNSLEDKATYMNASSKKRIEELEAENSVLQNKVKTINDLMLNSVCDCQWHHTIEKPCFRCVVEKALDIDNINKSGDNAKKD